MRAIFTDYDTVKMDNNEEMTTKDFFNFFEKSIKSGKITCCRYDSKKEEFSYTYCGDKYFIKISDKNTHNLRILLTLMELENNESVKRKSQHLEEIEREELLKQARDGVIKNEEAKQLYLKELKKELKDLFKISNNLYDIWNFDVTPRTYDILSPILSVLEVLGVMALAVSLGLGLTWWTIVPCIYLLVDVFLFISEYMDDLPLSTFPSWLVSSIITNYIENTPKRKLLKHKIKWLKEYKLPVQEIDLSKTKQENNTWADYIEKHINNIYVNLAKLDDEDKSELREELETKLRDYRSDLSNVPASGLTLENEMTISSKFIVFLSELEQRIDEKLKSKTKSYGFSPTSRDYQEEAQVSSMSSGKSR